MKKFFALLCTMAMVMSLFSGVVLAATQLTLTLDDDTAVPYLDKDGKVEYFAFSGKVTANGRTPNGRTTVEIWSIDENGNKVKKVESTDTYSGSFEFELEANDTFALGTQFKVYAKNDNYADSSAKTVTLGYKVVVDTKIDDLEYLSEDLKYISGKLVDGDGDGVSGVDVRVVFDDEVDDEEDGISEGKTSRTGRFELGVGQLRVAKLLIQVKYGDKWLTSKSYTVDPLEFVNFDKGVTSVKKNLGKVTLGGTDDNLWEVPEGSSFKAADKKYIVVTVTGAGYDDDEFDWNDEITFTATGTVKVEVNWKDKLVSTYTITVGNPAAVNISGSEEYAVGKTDREFTITLANGEHPDRVVAELNATGLEDAIVIDSDDSDSSVFEYDAKTGKLTFIDVAFEQAGTVTLEVTAYYGGVKKGNASFEAKIGGFRVVSSETEFVVDTKNTFTVTVTDANGNPVNNANVYILQSKDPSDDESDVKNAAIASVLSSKKNIVNGVYTFTDVKFTTVEDLELVVFQNGTRKAVFMDYIVVKGEEVYTLEVNNPVVLAGVSTDMEVLVKDADGNVVAVDGVWARVDGGAAENKDSTWNSSKKYTFSVTPTKSLVLEARTNNGKKIGSITIDVVKPELQFDRANITDGVKQTYKVKIVNPITGEELNGVLDFTYEGLEAAPTIQDTNGNPLLLNGEVASSEFAFRILADAKSASDLDDDEVPSLTFSVTPETGVKVKDVATLKVLPATLTSDKANVIIGGANDIVLTLADANGVGLSNKTIKLNGSEVGKTDSEGKLATSIYAVGASTYTFTYTNDASEDVKVSISAVRDTEAPVVTLGNIPAQTTAEYVTITGVATDNVGVANIYVGNAVAVGIPGADGLEFTYDVALKVGANNITVVVVDEAGNRAAQTITVTRVLPTVVRLAIGSADATINGTPAAGVAPYLKNNSTMVPFRFIAEALGAYVEWNAEAQTVTLTLDGTTVVLTIGSTTAFVNGEAKTMPVAPEITDGRTMVPLRFVGEALGAVVDYNAATGGITVTR